MVNSNNIDEKIKQEPSVADDLAEALALIAWGGWKSGCEEEAALEHIKIAIRALQNAGYINTASAHG